LREDDEEDSECEERCKPFHRECPEFEYEYTTIVLSLDVYSIGRVGDYP
jgi:hypothetical protein